MNISGADLIIRILEAYEVRIVAGVPGGAILPLYEALGRSTLITHVLTRHEQAAGFIAQGMARLSGRAGVCFATSGPGVTNVVTALADAKLDSVPLVCIAGQVPTSLIGSDAFQEVATVKMATPITKACFFVKSAEELPEILNAAFSIAETGRPGPVLIDIPKDVQQQLITLPDLTACRRQPIAAHSLDEAQSTALAMAADLIAHAHRPLLYCGGGIVKAGAQGLARQLAETLQIPMTTTLMGLGILPREHPLNLGMLGMHGARYTNHAIEAADVLIAIGARFDDRATGDPQRFATNARIIHIDIDARELGKIKPVELGIQADAHTALRELIMRLHGKSHDRSAWHRHLDALRCSHPLHTPRSESVCSPYGIMRALSDHIPAHAVITTDVGQHQMWVAQALNIPDAQRWLTSGGLGTMGFGLPAAMGAALADEQATVLCVTGDGSLLMNIQELATLAELQLNVKIILLDNGALGMVRQQQDLFYGRRHVASRYLRSADFVAIARAFGIPAIDLGKAARPAATLSEQLASRGPVLIRVPIEEQEHVLPMVAPGAANLQAIDHA